MIEKIKNLPFVRWVYKMPWLVRGYHLFWALLGAVIYWKPSRKIKVIGITGTKGKTSVVEILNAIFEAAGKKTALLSSLRVKIGEKSKKNMTGNTMPGRMFIQRFLRRAVQAGSEYAFVEVTSQGIVLYRHAFINWAGAALTNLQPEHIESHGSFEKYREAKLSFLEYVGLQGAPIFLNSEGQEKDFFAEALKDDKLIFYSKENLPDLDRKVFEILPGEFSKQNIALAIAAAKEFEISEEDIKKGLENFKGVPGRVEFVQKKPFQVIVDYAHTPNSLEAIYKTFKDIVRGKGRLICILGSAGGGRDKWKRPEMGKVAAKYCDIIIMTNEDPYDENPSEILNQIKKGIVESSFAEGELMEILDRRRAIKKAVEVAKTGDAIIATGKGSESWIHLKKGEKIPWDEREVFEEELKNKKMPE